ncbi:MAG TPA: sulfite oxidase-like oxidoreductase [archaeon]|nr:sulfite oxidase-like oxidoreductase [archaeon]
MTEPEIKKFKYKDERLPPGQVLTPKFPVLYYADVPKIDLKKWTLEVTGLVEKPKTFSWEEFLKLHQEVSVSDMSCVTRWTRLDMKWEGVKFADFLKVVKPNPEAKHVLMKCYDGYTTNLPLEEMQKEDVLLAWKWDGKPLTPEHGWPLRVVVPHKYGWKSAKWIWQIHFTERDEKGYWETHGYSNSADIWAEERFAWDPALQKIQKMFVRG